VLEGLGLAERLDAIVCSADVGLHKPDPRIFELACDRLGAEPGRCLHVGDHLYADVLGARASGLTAVLIARSGEAPRTPVPVIRSLESLEGLLT
jgi:putative hydrolase of the HAD superfamily